VSEGAPFTPTFGANGDPLGLNRNDPRDFPNRLKGPGCKSLINPGNVNNYIKTEFVAVPTTPPSFITGPSSSDPRLGANAHRRSNTATTGREIQFALKFV